MSNAKEPVIQQGLPEGYSAIPIQETNSDATVRVCVLVRQTPDPAAGHLVLLRDLDDAAVYLGCITDAGGRVREWAEIWVQNVDGLSASLPALSESFSNHSMDERWSKTAESLAALNPDAFIKTGWETHPPLPAFLDLTQKKPIHPGPRDNRWKLCRDDSALQKANLPAYGTSLFRYLYQPGSNETRFIPIVSGAATNAATSTLEEALKEVQAHVPFNPQGGLLMAQNFHPLSFEDYSDLLGGKAWKGIEHGKRTITFDGPYRNLNEWSQLQQNGAHLFLGNKGQAGRFVEAFHLKIQLLLDACTIVRSFVERQQLPFLNLGPDSFRVALGKVGHHLPYLWTATCALARPGQAYPLPVETSDFRYFVRARAGGTSIYQPEGLNASLKGTGNVRIRKVLPPEQGRIQVEGTLVMQEKLNVSPHDLLWIRLPLPNGRLDLYGHLYTTDGLAQGEARFRTVPQALSAEHIKAMQSAEGVSFPRSPFEIVPLLSSPCDLYALGVLAVRALLVNPQNSLGVALDEVLSLARQVATEYNADTPLATRVQSIMTNSERFAESLAPHRLVQEPMEAAAAYELLPPELWHHTLATIIRFFPGVGPDSYCKDFGDAPALALETVFNQPLEDLEKLLVRSRSLIFIDWHANREVHSAIRDLLDRQHS